MTISQESKTRGNIQSLNQQLKLLKFDTLIHKRLTQSITLLQVTKKQRKSPINLQKN